MKNDTRTNIFNGFGIFSSLFIVLSGSVVPHAIVDLMVQIFGALLIVWALITVS